MEWSAIVAIVGSAYTLASLIARATPTKRDDEIVSKIGKVLNGIFLSSKIKK